MKKQSLNGLNQLGQKSDKRKVLRRLNQLEKKRKHIHSLGKIEFKRQKVICTYTITAV